MALENHYRYYREKAQLRQSDIAQILGISQQLVSLIELDPGPRSLGLLLAYAAILELPLAALIPLTAQMPHTIRENGHGPRSLSM
jgi:transcriptional regulator with XRE-family HTH domain